MFSMQMIECVASTLEGYATYLRLPFFASFVLTDRLCLPRMAAVDPAVFYALTLVYSAYPQHDNSECPLCRCGL